MMSDGGEIDKSASPVRWGDLRPYSASILREACAAPSRIALDDVVELAFLGGALGALIEGRCQTLGGLHLGGALEDALRLQILGIGDTARLLGQGFEESCAGIDEHPVKRIVAVQIVDHVALRLLQLVIAALQNELPMLLDLVELTQNVQEPARAFQPLVHAAIPKSATG